jgi:betaine-aldehyde dehydrogenase
MTTVPESDVRRDVRRLAGRPLSNFVNGRWAQSSLDIEFAVHDPATGERLTTFQTSGEREIDAAMKAARAALDEWASRRQADRSHALLALADLCEQHAGDLSILEALDVGKPITAARDDEIPTAIDAIRFAAGAARALSGQSSGDYLAGATSLFLREPYGVIAAVTPWNFPLVQAVVKVAAALAVGNTMVLKPAEITPLSTARFVELANEVLPPGVLNLVLGTGAEAGELLVGHPQADLVSFTGSVATGSRVAAVAAANVKPSILELGGNAPVVVFDDVDAESAINGIASAGLYNCGQECMAATRLLVAESRFDEIVALLAARVSSTRLGDSLDTSTEMGPMVSLAQRDRVERKLASRSARSDIVTGGVRPDRPGYFFLPTVVTGLDPDEELVAQETFGPVFTVQPFKHEADAVAMANSTPYGLAASVWTRDVGRAIRVGKALKAGTVWINDHLNLSAETPVTGFGQSGFGSENGEQGLLNLTRLKHLAIAHG